MAVIITCKEKIIFHIRNAIFSSLYSHMLNTIEEKNLNLKQNLNELIERLELGGSGWGTDIAKFIKDKQDAIFFAELVREAILREEKELFGDYITEIKEELWRFYKEILHYAEELP
jgi:hypothetical protein